MMTEQTVSPPPQADQAEAVVPAALAGTNPAALYRRLRTERQVAWVPAATAVTSGLGDVLLHEQMMATLHTGGAGVLAVALGTGAGGTTLATGVAAWALTRTGTLENVNLKHLLWGSAGAGAVLTLFGDHPLIVGGYLVVAGLATAAWHKTRWKARRALHRALLQPPPALGPVEDDTELLVSQPGQPAETPAANGNSDIVQPDAETLAEYLRLWKAGVAKDNLAGSELRNGRVHAEGRVSFIVQSGPQGVRLAAVNAIRDQIASALRLRLPTEDGSGGQDVVFDQPPGEVTDRSQLRMQIINLAASTAASSQVTAERVSAPDNPYSVRIGGYLDDGSPAYWDFADDDGAYSGVVAAGTGLGKSSLVDQLAYRARQLGFHIAFLDPQRGASSEVLAEHADYPALGPEYALDMLDWLQAAADLRESWMAAHGLGAITPGMTAPCRADGDRPDPDCPCGGVVPPPILAVIEECDQVFTQLYPGTNTKLAEGYGELAKRIRKLLMAMVAVTQNPDLKTFGGSDKLRSNLPVRNLLAMHISSNTSGNLIPGLPYNPKLLPRISGRALMCGQKSRVMETVLDWMPRRRKAHLVSGPYAEDLFEALPRPAAYAPDQAAARRYLPQLSGNDGADSRRAARERLALLLSPTGAAGQAAPVASAPSSSATATIEVPELSWPEPVRARCTPPSAAELEAMLAATAASPTPSLDKRILTALAGCAGDEWLTFGELARRLGRVSDDADTATVSARARELSAELATSGWQIRTTRRASGLGATVADVRSALS